MPQFRCCSWEARSLEPELPSSCPPHPPTSAHRSQLLSVNKLAGQGDDGLDRIVIFAGRTDDKVLLNDVWELTLQWPNATWWVPPCGYPQRGRKIASCSTSCGTIGLRDGGWETGGLAGPPGRSPKSTWHWFALRCRRLLAPVQPAGDAAPAPRRGHSAVFVPAAHRRNPQMVCGVGWEALA